MKQHPWEILATAWLTYITSSCIIIIGSHFVYCPNSSCKGHNMLIPEGIDVMVWLGLVAVATILLVLHLFFLPSWKARIVSFVLNAVAVVGLLFCTFVMALQFGHWHF